MLETTMTLQRPEGTIYVSTIDGRQAIHLRFQVDQASDKEVVDHNMVQDHRVTFAYKLYTLDWYPNSLIKQDDILIDELYIDPDSGFPTKYRVVSRPKTYPGFHQQMLAEVVPGT